jgi:DNA-binding transcriptional LysR family regulator
MEATVESFTGIAAFVHVAEQRSYVKAARIIGVSPSAVGKAISRLEGRLGVRLFNRTTRSVGLTDEGAIFYERCKRIVEDLDEAEALIVESRDRPKGRLRVSLPHIVGHHLVMPALPTFVNRYPEIELDISFEDRVVDLVADGFDIAIRSGDLADTGLIARRLGDQHFVICASPTYLNRTRCPIVPTDLCDHTCIHFKFPSTGRVAPWAFGPSNEGFVLPMSLIFNNTDAGLRAALDGVGLAHLPVYVASTHIQMGALIPVLASFMVPFGSLSLVWPSNRRLSPKLRAFADFIVENLKHRQNVFQSAATLLPNQSIQQ